MSMKKLHRLYSFREKNENECAGSAFAKHPAGKRSHATSAIAQHVSRVLYGIPVGQESPRFSAGTSRAGVREAALWAKPASAVPPLRNGGAPRVPSFFSGYRRHGPPVYLSALGGVRVASRCVLQRDPAAVHGGRNTGFVRGS